MKRACSGVALEGNLQPQIALQEHLTHVQSFLLEMYQTMVDPVEEFDGNISQLCELLLKTAREQREQLTRAGWNWNR